ncbi:MAG: hypothetical protein K2Q22_16945, partial [Cytophagales bacterium]|nr:hypothetical protein [Cytophagales bacterium]
EMKTNDLICKVAITSDFSRLVHAERDVYFKDFGVKEKDQYSLVSIVFDSDKNMNNFEFLLWSSGKTELFFKGLYIQKLD